MKVNITFFIPSSHSASIIPVYQAYREIDNTSIFQCLKDINSTITNIQHDLNNRIFDDCYHLTMTTDYNSLSITNKDNIFAELRDLNGQGKEILKNYLLNLLFLPSNTLKGIYCYRTSDNLSACFACDYAAFHILSTPITNFKHYFKGVFQDEVKRFPIANPNTYSVVLDTLGGLLDPIEIPSCYFEGAIDIDQAASYIEEKVKEALEAAK